MKATRKIMAATIIGVTAIMASTALVNAASFTSYDPNVMVETPNNNWKEVSDSETLITLTDGKDVVKVKEFQRGDEIPTATTKDDRFEEIYQTFYTTSATTYLISGFAQTKDSIDEVRSVVESIQLADHKKAETKKEEQKQEQKQEKKAERTGNSVQIFDKNGNAVTVFEYTDGTWKDDNGVTYWTTVEHEWANSNGVLFYDYKPQAPEGEIIDSVLLFSGVGNPVTIYQDSTGEWLSDEGIRFRDNCDGTWSSNIGELFYETDDPEQIKILYAQHYGEMDSNDDVQENSDEDWDVDSEVEENGDQDIFDESGDLFEETFAESVEDGASDYTLFEE